MNAKARKKTASTCRHHRGRDRRGLAVNVVQGRTSSASTMVGTVYGLLLSVAIGGVELFVLDGPMRDWLSRLSFTVNLIVRSTIYAAIIMIIAGVPPG